MPNLPNPDVNTFDVDTDGQNRTNIESESDDNESNGKIPIPPDGQRDNVPIEEAPDVKDKLPVDEDSGDDMERIV